MVICLVSKIFLLYTLLLSRDIAAYDCFAPIQIRSVWTVNSKENLQGLPKLSGCNGTLKNHSSLNNWITVEPRLLQHDSLKPSANLNKIQFPFALTPSPQLFIISWLKLGSLELPFNSKLILISLCSNLHSRLEH